MLAGRRKGCKDVSADVNSDDSAKGVHRGPCPIFVPALFRKVPLRRVGPLSGTEDPVAMALVFMLGSNWIKLEIGHYS